MKFFLAIFFFAPIFGSPYPIIVEIGARTGELTKQLATLFPAGAIYAFEENDNNYELLGIAVRDFDNVWIIRANGLSIHLENWRLRHKIAPIDLIIVHPL